MAVTVDAFLTEFAQFKDAAPELVSAKLALASRRVGVAWGTLQDDGIKYLAAHLIAIDPSAESASLARAANGADNWSKTTYWNEYLRLQAEARSGFFGTAGEVAC